jgi:prepilin-type N-terminal cleavage/methylation domain-containing protein
MKKAFTLIELLVVIAIIAILAAILFPVFSQAKLAAKKTVGLTQVKQIGTSMQLYVGDYDDMLFPYRLNGTQNPDYARAIAARGQAYADSVVGTSARNVIFFNQLLQPYMKNNDIFKAPTKPNAWAGVDTFGSDTEPAFRSYGGQNSYGVNNYVFTSQAGTSSIGGGLNMGEIAEPSNTLIMVDASYYNVLPRFVGRLNGYTGTFNVCSSSYPLYWKNLGNSYLFRWNGGPNTPSDAEALRLINNRYNGPLNMVQGDTSSRAVAANAILNNLRDRGAESFWDPYKLGNTPCP